ncbi:sodium- and chloride-dependent GABA transporter ine-like [Brachionus plicatilis]|uniref:Transporter n=1 Tax=Brachionus plicatilis TaxID=10195 RepID=A0A3M7QGY2_BRAPC|nr:sodium- and chloride-dependent GABA transporter ine-like [Brachionus plicatilis]
MKREIIPLSKDDFSSTQSKLELKLSIDDTTDTSSEDTNSEVRENWGNVWRFGYLCAKSGGGAFLIPYFINLLIVAIPLMFMEFSVGQFTQRGPIGAMSRICPLFKGTGIATVVLSFFLTTYYIVIIAWDLYFLFSSIGKEVRWQGCNNSWNTIDCWDGSLDPSLKTSNDSRSPTEEFFRFKILNQSSSIEEFGLPKVDLLLLVILGWILVYFCIWKGVKSTGKVVYVTAIFPYLVLIIILVRGVTLDGSIEGLKYFLIPKWGDLLKPSVWANAAIQNFNSIGVTFGGLISMSSYNKRSNKILGNVIAISIVDAFTSLVCGSTVFSVLGYIAKTQSKTVDDVIESGPGLIFMVLPEAIRNMSLSPIWGILFFTMIFMLGIDSQFTMVETVITTIEDEFHLKVKKYIKKREILVLIVCVFTFFFSLPNICPGGIYYFTIVDFFSAGVSLFYIAFFEIIAIVWIYGANRLAKNVFLMTGSRPAKYFKVCWYVVSPLFITVVWLFNWIRYEPIKYGSYEFPAGAQIFGWCIALVSILAVPLGAIHTLVKSPGKTMAEKFFTSLKPTILDIDQTPNEYTTNKVENRADFIKRNETLAEIVEF